MSIDPTYDEWEAARERLAEYDGADAGFLLTEAALGPCPPEGEPPLWRAAGGAIGSLVVMTHADGGVWVGFPNVKHQTLTADEADAMACSLIEHAAYAREQEPPR